MPRCLMAKKWKAYPWPDRQADPDSEEEIDVVGDVGDVRAVSSGRESWAPAASPQGPWAPSSPTEGATAPSPPPPNSANVTVLYNESGTQYSAFLPQQYPETARPSEQGSRWHEKRYQVLSSLENRGENSLVITSVKQEEQQRTTSKDAGERGKKSVSMWFTSTGAALSLPPKKKDIYRPYSLDDRPAPRPESPVDSIPSSPSDEHRADEQQLSEQENLCIDRLCYSRPAEDIRAAQAILDLSASTHLPVPEPLAYQLTPPPSAKTVAYTYEAFFVSDGRSKKKAVPEAAIPPENDKAKYTCTECGKQYATSSNLSRHKQTHRSLDSQSAKKCMTCGKAYVSMPALAMHLLTHKLSHGCGVCGKLFSRPWLLQGHLRSHTGEKPYGCAHCGKAFADRSNLRAHMQTHSVDKNYVCERCNKPFALKSYLNKHLESACFKDKDDQHYNYSEDGEMDLGSPLTPPQSPQSHEGSTSSYPL